MMRKRREARLHRSLTVVERLTAAERELVLTAIETLVAACDPRASRRKVRRQTFRAHRTYR